MNFPNTTFGEGLLAEINRAHPGSNITNMTYQEIVTQYHDFYVSFLSWYNTFFGPSGILSFETS